MNHFFFKVVRLQQLKSWTEVLVSELNGTPKYRDATGGHFLCLNIDPYQFTIWKKYDSYRRIQTQIKFKFLFMSFQICVHDVGFRFLKTVNRNPSRKIRSSVTKTWNEALVFAWGTEWEQWTVYLYHVADRQLKTILTYRRLQCAFLN